MNSLNLTKRDINVPNNAKKLRRKGIVPGILYGNELKVTDRFIYTTSKKVTISASDGQGSGIAGYYLALDTNQTCFKSGLSFQSSNTFTISNTGNYLICVKDKAGNISGYSGLNITYIK